MRPQQTVPASYVLTNAVSGFQLPIVLANELRAIFPAWFLAAVFQCTGFIDPQSAHIPFAIICAGLPAMAFGHDFLHKTVSFTLSMPIQRAALWRMRMAISFFGLLPLAVLALLQWRIGDYHMTWVQAGLLSHLAAILSQILTGLCLAPFLTLLLRNALAGTVFTVAEPFALYQLLRLLIWIFYPDLPSDAPQVMQFQALTGFIGFSVACALGLFASYRRLARLEAIEPRGLNLRWPRVFSRNAAAPSPRKLSATWQLCLKEFRLQYMCVVPALALAVTCWLFKADRELDIAQALLWGWLGCVIIGAAGSAEEMQLGLAESQALLPLARTRQWMIKVGVLFALTLVFAVIAPALILTYGPSKIEGVTASVLILWSVTALITVAASLYISSISRTTMRATLGSLGLPIFLPLLTIFLSRNGGIETKQLGLALRSPGLLIAFIIALAAFFTMTLRFAMHNHFSAERGSARIAGQVFYLMLMLGAASVLILIAYILESI